MSGTISFDEQSVPQLHPQLDWGKVRLNATEGFILSRVDGASAVLDIILGAGIGEENARAVIRKLRDLRLIFFQGEEVPEPPHAGAILAAAPTAASAAQPGQRPASDAPPLTDSVEELLRGFVESGTDHGESTTSAPSVDDAAADPAPAPAWLEDNTARSDPAEPEPVSGRAGPRTPPASARTPTPGAGAPPPEPRSGPVTPTPRPQTPTPPPQAYGAGPTTPSPGAIAPPGSSDLEDLLKSFVDAVPDLTPEEEAAAAAAPVAPAAPEAPAHDSDELAPGAFAGSGIEYVQHDGVNLPRAELEEEGVDLDLEVRQQVLVRFYRLNETDYYSLLGIEPRSSRKEVKRGFRDFSRLFHPDRFYRKQLGSYASKLETLFKFAKRAHDVLMNDTLRVQYDATRDLEAPVAPDEAPVDTTSARATTRRGDAPAAEAKRPDRLRKKEQQTKKPTGPKLTSAEGRAEVDALYLRLDAIDHFTLLGVAFTASRKDIKRAYFKLSKRYHPDKHRTEELGEYANKIAAIFKALTKAHKVLAKDEKRQQYSEALRAAGGGPPPESGPMRVAAGEGDARRQADRQARRDAELRRMEERRKREEATWAARGEPVAAGTPPPAGAAPGPGPSRAPSGPSRSVAPIPGRHLSGAARLRREAEKRRAAEDVRRTVSSGGDRRRAQRREALLRKTQAGSGSGGKLHRARQFFEQGKRDLEEEKWASATSNFKLAQSYGMKDQVLDALQERAHREASRMSAAQYAKQADYASSVGDKKIASDLYDRAAQAEPTPENLHRAALALLRGHGDLHRATDYAMRATQADPENVEYRMTLGLVYESAGLLRNALREMQAVQAVAPKTPGLKEQIQSLKKRL